MRLGVRVRPIGIWIEKTDVECKKVYNVWMKKNVFHNFPRSDYSVWFMNISTLWVSRISKQNDPKKGYKFRQLNQDYDCCNKEFR